MSYAVKEIYATLQGEGANVGRPAIFLRFAGCNLWSGREADRAEAICNFCDTDFVGTDGPNGGRFEQAAALAGRVRAVWDAAHGVNASPFVVATGGEPLLQLDANLVAALHDRGFTIAVETNGTIAPPERIDWLCVSPKAGAALKVARGEELKLVYPQATAAPEAFESLDFKHFFLQPLDGPERERHLAAARDYCLRHPKWRLSLQAHKLIGMP
ncbi:MAG: 7-carboxy-7-deazaguanine synthase [Alphaproteobacteria bacterium]|nr:7-carboxy-7-deazaguanine synthase [Alphaproteobacteria bacterium]